MVTDKLRFFAAALKTRNGAWFAGTWFADLVGSSGPSSDASFPPHPKPTLHTQLPLSLFPFSAAPMENFIQFLRTHKGEACFPVSERLDNGEESLGIRGDSRVLEKPRRDTHFIVPVGRLGHCRFVGCVPPTQIESPSRVRCRS